MYNFIKRSISVTLVLLLIINVIYLSIPLNNVYANDLYENKCMDSAPENKMVNANEIMSTNKAESNVNSVSSTEAAINLSEVLLPENAVISDSVINPLQPVLYAVDTANSKLYAINYETNSVTETSISLKPERIAYSNGKLYLTLLKAKHSSYIDESQQFGAIAVIDASDLSLIKQIDVNTDPFDIVVCGDNIYIPSGSGQWTYINSYSEATGKLISIDSIRQASYVELNSTLNKIYTVDTDSSPRDHKAYEINNGTFTRSYDSPYHGDYWLTDNFKISPDGKYIFNGSGNIFTSSSEKSKDMLYYTTLKKAFSDVAFDLENNKFYTAISGKLVYSYDYNTFNGTKTYRSVGEIQNLYYRKNLLIALSKLDNSKYIVEKIDSSGSGESFPVNEVQTVQLPKNDDNFELNYSINDSVIDPFKNIIYITDSKYNKIASINYETGETKELGTFYSPGSIAYHKDELYIGYGEQGKIGIYDAQNLTLKDVIYTGATFFDLNVGNDGYIYTSSKKYARSYSRTSKQEVSKPYSFEKGYLEVHPTLNSLYMSSMDVSPTDLYVLNYNAGTLTKQYNSPYHGDYYIASNNRISPDGKYIFNGYGNVFTSSSDEYKDMLYYKTLKNNFSDIAFDLENNKFYAGYRNYIHIHNYSTFEQIRTYSTQGSVKRLYLRNGKLIAVSSSSTGKDIIEIIDTVNPIKQVTGISINKTSTNIEFGKTEQLTATVLPENAINKNVVWSIQNGIDVVSLSKTGLITTLKPGTAVVRVTSLGDPTKYAECSVTVERFPAAQLTGFTWAQGSSLGTTRATVIPAGTLKYVVGAAKMQVRPKEGYPSTAYTNTLTANADIPVTAGQHIFIVGIYNDGTIKSWIDVAVDTANIKSAPIYGDLNDDGEINALDFALMKQYLLGNTTDINKKNADMNSDGVINAIDFALLKKQLLK